MSSQQFMLDLECPIHSEQIDHRDKIMVVGSCFTEHMGNFLQEHKFDVLQNPNGILFDPLSISNALTAYTKFDHYRDLELNNHQDTWFSWQHHSRFSGLEKETVLNTIREAQKKAHEFLKQAKWLIITPGTSFHYRLKRNNIPVANCHKVPGSDFRKILLSIEETNSALDNCLHQLFHFNPKLRVIFTVSPVRHIKDGIVENNRSKARLLEVIHHLVNKFDRLYYFPAYELVIDVLRDYRFYTEDMVHPNAQAVNFVTEKFLESFINKESIELTKEIAQVLAARNHRPFNPASERHQQFLKNNLNKLQLLKNRFPYLDFLQEENYFNNALTS